MHEITRMLENFVESDPTIKINEKKEIIKDKITKEMQKIYDEFIQITPAFKEFFEKHCLNDAQTIYIENYFKYSNEDFSLPYSNFTNNYNFLNIYFNAYIYKLGWSFTDRVENRQKIIDTFAKVCKEDWKNLIDATEKYNKIIKEMIIILNSLKTAQNILDKFGFIESINRYINTLLAQQAKPISCMTQAVENSVDNYLKQRKELDEDKK